MQPTSEENRELRSPRLPGLDLIRAVAIAWVTLYHAMNYDFLPDSDHWYVNFGWMGVDIFFVLSGFLIAGQLLKPFAKNSKPDYLKFFSRRLLRTLPAYAAMLAIYFLLPSAREVSDIQPFWQFATFSENILIDLSTHKAFSHVWSLCVEEQFYLLLPLVVMLVSKYPSQRRVLFIITGLLLFGMTVRGILWLTEVTTSPIDIFQPPNWLPYMKWIYYPTWARLDGLLAGVAAATIKLFRPNFWKKISAYPNALLVCGVIGIGASMLLFEDQFASFIPTVFGFPILSVSIALIVISGTSPRSLIGRYQIPGVRALATGAYSLYLSQKIAYHLVIVGIIPSFGATGILYFMIAIAAALALAAGLYWGVERPFLKLRDRLDGPSRSSIAA